MKGMRGHWYRAALFMCGAALFSYLIVRIGPGAVVESFRVLSWRLALVAVFPSVLLKACDTIAWRYSFPCAHVPFRQLGRVLLAGQAVTFMTPTGLGGDALKAWMLRDRVGLRESLASIVILKTTVTAAQGCFLLIGILVSRWTVGADATLVQIMEVLLLLDAIGVAGFIAVQLWGVMTGGHRILERLGLSGGATLEAAAEDVDQTLSNFYRHQPRQLGLSFAFNLLAWLIGASEVWLILYFLGQPVSPTTALVIEAFGTGIDFATFFVPGRLGFAETGAVATFLALGLNGATGLSFSLVRRVGDLTWVGIGLLLIAGRPMPSAAALSEQEA